MHHLLKQCGIRSLEPPKEGQTITKRTEIMQCHGLRKFFETPVPFYQYMWWEIHYQQIVLAITSMQLGTMDSLST